MKIILSCIYRYSRISESKSFHDALDGDPAILDGSFDGYDDNEIISENITLETEAERRQRLDSFYSATSAKSTYFSTGSISSYHSIEDPNNGDIGKLLIHNANNPKMLKCSPYCVSLYAYLYLIYFKMPACKYFMYDSYRIKAAEKLI